MKKFVYPILLLCLITFKSLGQNITIGFRGGISIPNLTAGSGNQSPLSTGYGSRLGPDISVFTEFRLSEVFALRPMVEYSAQGGKKNGLQAFTTPDELKTMLPPGQVPNYLYANYKSEAKLNYLLLPILVKAGWNIKGSPLKLYLAAGPFIGLLLSAHQVTNGESQFFTDPAGQQPLPGGSQSFNDNTNVRTSLHRVNAGFEGNLGLSYTLGPNSIFIEGGGNYGFFNIQQNTADGKNETGAAVATIGFSRTF
jgi:hypothetical protein